MFSGDKMEAKTFVMPLAVIGTIALVYALLKRSTPATVILAQTGGGANPASVGGAPLTTQSQIIQQGATPVQPGTVQQIPSAAPSGVPTWAGQVQSANDVNDTFRRSVTTLAPSAAGQPDFYAPVQQTQSNIVPQPASQPKAAQVGYVRSSGMDNTQPNGKTCSCGGGGDCDTKPCVSCTPKCSTFNSRYSDGRGGCLAMDRRRQIQAATRINPQIWKNLQYQLQTSGNYDFFLGFQEDLFFRMRNHPATEGFTEPAAPPLSVSGNSMY
jgi:hypothetical protein